MRRDPLDDFIDAAVRVLDLPIDDAWKPAIKGHLQVTFAHAARVAEFELPDDAEGAPIFRA